MSHPAHQSGTSTPGTTRGTTRGTTGTTGTTGNGGAAAKGAAVVLWVIVGGGLAYGVTQTVIRAAQLFS